MKDGKYPAKYTSGLSKEDKKKQKKNLDRSRREYKRGVYVNRPKLRSYKNKKSKHVENAKRMYNVESISAKTLAKPTKCTEKSLRAILKKGRGAFYSSGSRPNQSAESWARARLASSVSAGPASCVDMKELERGCKPESKALRIAKRACKK